MNDKTSVGLYIDKSVLDDVASAMKQTNCKSRNEFITEAIRFYIAFLNRKNYSDILTPAYESVITAKIGDTENRIARVIFKQSVELAMMMHIVAANNDVDQQALSELKKLCVDEVSRLGGRYKFEDAVRFQKE